MGTGLLTAYRFNAWAGRIDHNYTAPPLIRPTLQLNAERISIALAELVSSAAFFFLSHEMHFGVKVRCRFFFMPAPPK